LSLNGLARKLESEGIPSPSGNGHWLSSTLNSIIKNRAYLGETFCKLKSGECISLPDVTPRIIDDELFDKAHGRMATNLQLSKRNTRHDYLLRGMIYCGVCGQHLDGKTNRSNKKLYRYYSCRSISREDLSYCGLPSVNADIADKGVWDTIADALAQPNILMRMLNFAETIKPKEGELKAIEAELKANDKAQSKLLDEVIGGNFTNKQIESRCKVFNNKRAILEKRKAEAQERTTNYQAEILKFKSVEEACRIWRCCLDKQFNTEAKRKTLIRLNVRVIQGKDEGKIEADLKEFFGEQQLHHQGGKPGQKIRRTGCGG